MVNYHLTTNSSHKNWQRNTLGDSTLPAQVG